MIMMEMMKMVDELRTWDLEKKIEREREREQVDGLCCCCIHSP
jgi:hypothetical protein